MPVGKYVSSAPKRQEWLIQRENVKFCVWFGMVRGFFHSYRAPHSSQCGVWLDSPLTNTFAVTYVGLYHVYVPALHSYPDEQCNIHDATNATIIVAKQSEHKLYRSNGNTFDTNPLRIIRTALRIIQYHP